MADDPDVVLHEKGAAPSPPGAQIALPTISSLRQALQACGVAATDDELEELLPGVLTILRWAMPASSVAPDVQPIFMGPMPEVRQ